MTIKWFHIKKMHNYPEKHGKFKRIAPHSRDVVWNSAFRQRLIETAHWNGSQYFLMREFVHYV